MSQSWLRMWAALAFAASATLGCGSKPGQAANDGKTKVEEPVKKPPTPEGSAFERIPKSAFFAVGFGRPVKTAGRVKEILGKTGISPETNQGFKEGLEEFKKDAGFDPFDAESVKKLGVDTDKGVAFALDSELLLRETVEMDWAALAT